MTRTTRLTPMVICLLLPLMAFAADWPRWHGPDANNISPETGINKDWNSRPPQTLWQVQLHDNGYAGPSAADGKVFIIDHDGAEDVVRAISLADGSDVWQYRYQDLSKHNYGYSRSTPVYDSGRLYTISFLGKVHCLDAATGRKIWMRDMHSEFGGKIVSWGYSMSALVDGDRVIVCPGGSGAAVAALSTADGRTIWKGGGSDPPGYATPVKATILGIEQYVVFTGKSLIGVAADNGRLLWRFPWETSYDVNAATPIVSGDAIFITSGYNHGCGIIQIETDGPVGMWSNKEVVAHFSSPVYYNRYIFANSDPGNLVCLDPRTGQSAWKQGGFGKGGLVAVDGTIIAMNGRNGDVVMVEAIPDRYHELGRIKPFGNQITNQNWTAPIIADGRLIVRNKKLMVCLDIR